MKQTFFHLLILLFIVGAGLSDARKGNEAYSKGDYAEAESLFRSAIEQNPENGRLYFNLGNALAKQDKTQDAIEAFMDFERLATDASDKALAEYSIGTLLANDEKWKPAQLHLKNALKYNPNDSDAKRNYELAFTKADEEDEKKENEQQENQDQPKPTEYALAIKKQAEKLVSEKQYNQAYNLMQQALEADETVGNFSDFIERIGSVDQIDS
ncbi:MAG: tetratricopeptide repeat protein [Balneolaceae bacterium]